jgi:hypothetical protein
VIPLISQSPVQPHKICIFTGGQKRASRNLARPDGGSDQQKIEAHASKGHGHMNQRRKNIRSTSKTPIISAIKYVLTTDTHVGTKTHIVYAVLVDQGQLYTDLTVKNPVRYSKGNSSIMVCYV